MHGALICETPPGDLQAKRALGLGDFNLFEDLIFKINTKPQGGVGLGITLSAPLQLAILSHSVG